MMRRKLMTILAAVLLACGAAAIFAARAYNSPAPAPVASATMQGGGRSRSRLHSRLAFQPEVDRLRRRLGQRFVSSGREVSSMIGSVTINGQGFPVTIIRRQDDDDEQISISIAGRPQLNWNGRDGARAAGGAATGDNRKLVERIALDSLDQFILAQLRLATYRTIGHNVVPAGAGDEEDYSGPSWDVVQVGEPPTSDTAKPLSQFRYYYINTSTGLIDRVISYEDETATFAEFSDWVDQAGEKLPSRITWKRNGAVVMELVLSGASHGPRQ
jgi:hypothetical protein